LLRLVRGVVAVCAPAFEGFGALGGTGGFEGERSRAGSCPIWSFSGAFSDLDTPAWLPSALSPKSGGDWTLALLPLSALFRLLPNVESLVLLPFAVSAAPDSWTPRAGGQSSLVVTWKLPLLQSPADCPSPFSDGNVSFVRLAFSAFRTLLRAACIASWSWLSSTPSKRSLGTSSNEKALFWRLRTLRTMSTSPPPEAEGDSDIKSLLLTGRRLGPGPTCGGRGDGPSRSRAGDPGVFESSRPVGPAAPHWD